MSQKEKRETESEISIQKCVEHCVPNTTPWPCSKVLGESLKNNKLFLFWWLELVDTTNR